MKKINNNTQQMQINLNTSSTSKEAILIKNDGLFNSEKRQVLKKVQA